MFFIMKIEIGIKTKKNTSHISIQSIIVVKTIYWIQRTKKNRSRKNWGKVGKALHKLTNNSTLEKTMKNLRNRINIKLVNNEKDYLKCASKPIYMLHEMFDNNLVAMRKSKVTLKLNKPAYIGICILELSKVLMYKIHYDYIKNEYDNKSKLLFTDTDSLMYEIKTEDVYEDFSSNKEMFDFNNYSTKSKYCDDSNKLVILKMEDETGGFAIDKFVGLEPKMYSFLVDNNREHKKVKGVNRNLFGAIIHNKYKGVLLNNKCTIHSMNII